MFHSPNTSVKAGYSILILMILMSTSSLLMASKSIKQIDLQSISTVQLPLGEPVLTASEELQQRLQRAQPAPLGLNEPLGSTVVIINDGFEGGFPAGLWDVVFPVPGQPTCVWGKTTVDAADGSYSLSPVLPFVSGLFECGVPQGAGTVYLPGEAYPVDMDVRLTYGPFSLQGAAWAKLSLKLKYKLASSDDQLQVLYSTNGADFSTLAAPITGGNFQSWTSQQFPLSFFGGETSVTIMIRAKSDSDNLIAQGVLLDAFKIEKIDGLPTPDLDLQLIDAPAGTFSPGEEILITANVANIGSSAASDGIISLDFHASIDNLITSGDPFIGTCQPTGGIPVGNLGSFTCSEVIPLDLPNGTYFIGGILDYSDLDNTNHTNFDATKITVSAPPPAPEFDSTPAASSIIDFFSAQIGNSSIEKTIRIDNLGTSNLTIDCGKSGSHTTDFKINACESPIAAGGNTNISLVCEPTAPGTRSATLNVSTNDADESRVSYNLTCFGQEEPLTGDIFVDGFEGNP